MADHLSRDDFIRALGELGRLSTRRITLTLAGSVAMILQDPLHRATQDGDVLESSPELDRLREVVREIARSEGIPAGWLNTSVQSYREVLPPDFDRRLTSLGLFGRLSVRLLGRRDFILMKFYAGRAQDLADLREVRPTSEDLAFVRGHYDRLHRLDPEKAARMMRLVDAWEPRNEDVGDPGDG